MNHRYVLMIPENQRQQTHDLIIVCYLVRFLWRVPQDPSRTRILEVGTLSHILLAVSKLNEKTNGNRP